MPVKKKRVEGRRRFRRGTTLLLLFVFAFPVVLPHFGLLDLPFFWDEAGQFVPAALDLYQHGWWIPRSATPNVHPPGVMAYLAAVWHLFGFSVLSTRAAMLAVASLAMVAAFLLAVELCQQVRGIPALILVPLLCASPLFFTQSMMAQLDMPAMWLTSLTLVWFLKNKMRRAAAACTALVLVRETGLLVAIVLVLWLLAEKRLRHAAYFLVPAAALGAWLLILGNATGHLFGNSAFTQFNVEYLAHPVRMGFALGKRLYYLFFAGFHWIGTLGFLLGLWRKDSFPGRGWKVMAAVVAAHIGFFSLLGGAMLERYLLPVLPIVYIAMLAGWEAVPWRYRAAGPLAMIAGVIASLFVNPPYPFPYENNLAMKDFVELHQEAAGFLDRRYPAARVTSVWPLTAEISRPELGYVRFRHPVREVPDFSLRSVRALDLESVDLLVLYSKEWEPSSNLMRIPEVEAAWRRFFGYRPQISGLILETEMGLRVVGSWSRRGQWIEIYARRNP
jgi:hypothetical protein